MNGVLSGLAQGNVEGTFRKLDSALTVIRQDSCGKFLEYYPPVYIIAKFPDYLRPHLAGLTEEDDNGNDPSLSTVSPDSKVVPAVSTPAPKKKFFKKINPFSQNSSDENKTKAPPGNGSEQSPSSGPVKQSRLSKKGLKSQKKQQEKQEKQEKQEQQEKEEQQEKQDMQEMQEQQDKHDKQEQDGDYYPAEASDIDEDDDSDMEGGYTFN